MNAFEEMVQEAGGRPVRAFFQPCHRTADGFNTLAAIVDFGDRSKYPGELPADPGRGQAGAPSPTDEFTDSEPFSP